MKLQDFEKALQENGCYQSSGNRCPWFARYRWLCTAGFYIRIIGINVAAGIRSRAADYYPSKWQSDSFDILRTVEQIGGRINISGVTHLTEVKDPCVLIGNHMSSLETMILPAIIIPFKPFTFIVKSELLEYPFLGPLLKNIDSIAVTRDNPREDLKKLFEEGEKLINLGRSLLIFPQRTRTLSLNREEFNKIGIKVAKRFGATVIPFALKTDLWGYGRWFKDFGSIDIRKEVFVEFGAPFHVNGAGREEHEQVFRFIETKLNEWTAGRINDRGRMRMNQLPRA